jgi:subtilisin family serine protease
LKRDGTVVPVAINGNSFAGPMLVGAIALILSADPDLHPWDVRDILTTTATDVAKPGYDFETGHGLVNCYRAVKETLRRKAIREGKDPKPYEGREDGDSIDTTAARKNLKVRFKVGNVQPGGQADKLGMKVGDVIVSYNGGPISTQESMQAAKKKAEDANEQKIAVVLLRDDQRLTIQMTAGALGLVPIIEYSQPVFE